MKRLLLLSVSILSIAALIAGCSTNTGTGAAVGAGTGAVVAGPPGAAVGAASGAVVGAAADSAKKPSKTHRHHRKPSATPTATPGQ